MEFFANYTGPHCIIIRYLLQSVKIGSCTRNVHMLRGLFNEEPRVDNVYCAKYTNKIVGFYNRNYRYFFLHLVLKCSTNIYILKHTILVLHIFLCDVIRCMLVASVRMHFLLFNC